MQDIKLRAKGWSSEQLYAESEDQFQSLDHLDRLIDTVYRWFEQATDPDEKMHLWRQYSGLCQDFSVLSAWYNVTYSAYIFSLYGAELSTVSLGELDTADLFVGHVPS